MPDEEARAPEVRASDAERDEVVRQLSEHAGTGRLTLDEFEQRMGLAYAATTRADLAKLTSDLPATAQPLEGRRQPTRWVVALLGGVEKKGRWRIGDRVTTIAVMGGTELDLRHAEIDAQSVSIVAIALMGGIDIYVPDTVEMEVSGSALMGGYGERGSTRQPRPGGPRVRIKAFALMGGIDVWRLPEEARGVSLKEAKKLANKAR
ncbi:MAG: DUF1707 SHOCT-like domain-containing protein [Actinomycetota bacterium]